MKKILLTLGALLVLLGLVGCGKTTEVDAEFSTNLDAVYDAVIAEQPDEKMSELILFKETNEELINSYYEGLSDIELLEKNIYMHPIGFACEIALVKVNEDADIEKVKSVFDARIQKGIESTMCDSGAQDIWKRRATIQTKGKYACLIVLPDGYNIPEDIFALELQEITNVETSGEV